MIRGFGHPAEVSEPWFFVGCTKRSVPIDIRLRETPSRWAQPNGSFCNIERNGVLAFLDECRAGTNRFKGVEYFQFTGIINDSHEIRVGIVQCRVTRERDYLAFR